LTIKHPQYFSSLLFFGEVKILTAPKLFCIQAAENANFRQQKQSSLRKEKDEKSRY
jgi:hypothetical protein